MDKFEDFIQQQREALDNIEDTPKLKMWQHISEELEAEGLQKQTAQIRQLRHWVIGLAASVVLILGVGISYIANNHQASTKPPSFVKLENPINEIAPAFAEEEQQFKRLIAQKEAEINLSQLDKIAFAELFLELELLEEIHAETQQDIPEFSDNELLVKALTRYYEQKIRILERLSKEIDLQKEQEIRINEKPL